MDDPRVEPVACSLGPADGEAQLGEWEKLQEVYQGAEVTADGVHLWFDPEAEVAVRAVATTEAACCAFLRLEVVGEANRVRLEITSTDPAAQPVIALLASQARGHAPA